jgi:hypothetical protein
LNYQKVVQKVFSFRKCLAKWGYSASDVKILFEFMDVDGDGNLNLNEFMELFHQTLSRTHWGTAVQRGDLPLCSNPNLQFIRS